jgi:hypothetical protein
MEPRGWDSRLQAEKDSERGWSPGFYPGRSWPGCEGAQTGDLAGGQLASQGQPLTPVSDALENLHKTPPPHLLHCHTRAPDL